MSVSFALTRGLVTLKLLTNVTGDICMWKRSLSTTSNMKAKVWLLSKRPEGMPKVSDFKLVEEDLSPLKDGEVLFEAQYLSVDPYMRYRVRSEPLDKCMIGGQVAKVIESKHKDYPVGQYVNSYFGWRSHTKLAPDVSSGPMHKALPKDSLVPYMKYLGSCGMPGVTAYFGLLELCAPKSGEVVLVNGAAGAVGSAVGQIAKIQGCKVIGYAGTDDKVSYLKSLGFDHAYNYKKVDIDTSIKEAAPDGIDCYFDNVGGEFSAIVMKHMRQYGRVSLCGAISSYNDHSLAQGGPFTSMDIIAKELSLSGFIISSPKYISRWPEAIKKMVEWTAKGQIKSDETVVKGIENMPSAFIGLLKGDNVGKMIVSNVQ